MNKQIFLVLISFICLGASDIQAQDSLPIKKNQACIELFGNSYVSPFFSFLAAPTGISPLSINYCRLKVGPHYSYQFTGGIGLFRSWWVETKGRTYIYHRPIEPCLSAGVMFRHYFHYRKNGLWGGLFVTSAFGKQEFMIDPYISNDFETIKFDYQIEPNLSYQFSSWDQKLVCKISFMLKIPCRFFNSQLANASNFWILPWGGISIGGAW